jgi:hypothetical protein
MKGLSLEKLKNDWQALELALLRVRHRHRGEDFTPCL